MSMENLDRAERAALKFGDEAPMGEDLTPRQQELLRDMRASLRQLKRGDLLPAREALREIELDTEAEENARTSDAQVQISTEETAKIAPQS